LWVWVIPMELRHLRYFIAVAEEGSFSNAAERRLHTAQPSLSRQIRDLELEVGTKLLDRKARGVTLTPSGAVFLDYARLVLLQIEAASEAARRAERPAKAGFVVGFLSGQEVVWLPETLRILREEAPDTEIMVSSRSSPDLADALMQGRVDVAFLRRETHVTGLAFKFLIDEPLVAILPVGHRLAARKTIRPQDLARETFINPARLAPVLRSVISDYAAKTGITLKQKYETASLSAGMSLVVSTGGVTLLPLYARNVLIPSVVARPLQGAPPTIELVVGYNKSNTSPLLKRFLSRAEEMVARVRASMSWPATASHRGDV
jgi:LysR family transcriptional regulator, hca operon transcriptional activator